MASPKRQAVAAELPPPAPADRSLAPGRAWRKDRVTPTSSPDRPDPGRTALVTVTYNSGAVLPDFLASLSGQTAENWALIAIDNASSDDTVAQLEAWPGRIHAIERNDENIGFARGTNQGIRMAMEAGFDSVLIINNDTSFGPEFLQDLLYSPHRAAGPILAPLVRYADRDDICWYAGGGFTRLRGGLEVVMNKRPPDDSSEIWPATFAPGCCKLIDMAVFRRIGLFDERFFVYWEDADFCLRCRDAGIPLYVVRHPSLVHKASSLTGGVQSPFFLDQYHRNQIKLIRKRYGPLSLALQTGLIRAKIALRRLLGRDSAEVMRARYRAVGAGLSDQGAGRE